MPEKAPKLTEEQKRRIIQQLVDRGVNSPCPRCGNRDFTVLDGYFSQSLQTHPVGLVIGGTSVPSAVTACTRCGFLALHALGALGLLPPEGGKQ